MGDGGLINGGFCLKPKYLTLSRNATSFENGPLEALASKQVIELSIAMGSGNQWIP